MKGDLLLKGQDQGHWIGVLFAQFRQGGEIKENPLNDSAQGKSIRQKKINNRLVFA
jgi:hypothetical protein